MTRLIVLALAGFAFVASAAPAMAEGAKQPNQSVAPSSKGGHGHGGYGGGCYDQPKQSKVSA